MKASLKILAPIAALLLVAVMLLTAPAYAQPPAHATLNVSARAAEVMIINAERAINFTKTKLELAESLGNVTIPDTVKEALSKAEDLLAEAKKAFDEGDYSEVFRLALEATREARSALRELCLCCPQVRAEVNATVAKLKLRHRIRLLQEEALMLKAMAKRAAAITGNKTILEEVEKDIEEAKEKIKEALEALDEGNVTLAHKLMVEAQLMLKVKARNIVRKASVEICVKRMEKWKEKIQKEIEKAIERLEELKKILEERGANETIIEAIEARIEKLREIQAQLEEMNFTAPPVRLAIALSLRVHPLILRYKWALRHHVLANIMKRVKAKHVPLPEIIKELRKHGIPVLPVIHPRKRGPGMPMPVVPPGTPGPKGHPATLPPENVKIKAKPVNETAVKIEVTVTPPAGYSVSIGPVRVGPGHISVPVQLIPVNVTVSVVTPHHETLVVKVPAPGIYVVSVTHAGRVVRSTEVTVKPGQVSHEVSVTVTPGPGSTATPGAPMGAGGK